MVASLPSILVLACVATAEGPDDRPPLPDNPVWGRYSLTLRHGGWERTAEVVVPRGYRPGSRPPLVVFLHGAGGDGPHALDQDGWAAKADEAGFVVVAPTGLPARPRQEANFLTNPRVWNSGQLRAGSPRAAIDDVAYIAALLDAIRERLPYDAARVYATGHSNGAGMTFRLGAELSERFAALAPVAGMLALKDPKPSKSLPTLYVVGTKDPLQPIDGGEVTLPWGRRTNPPVADSLRGWARAIGCRTEPETVREDGQVKVVRYRSDSGGPELQAVFLEGHGHNWPGGKRVLPAGMVGPSADGYDATGAIWDFFQRTSRSPSRK